MKERLETIKELERNGFVIKRHGTNHDVYYNPQTHKTIPVKRHNFGKETKDYLLKEAGIK